VGFTCTTIKIVGPFRKCGTWSFSPPFFFVRFSLPLILAIYSMEKDGEHCAFIFGDE
jgi:hypothetical protein